MANDTFALCQEAANVAGITPQTIGVPSDNFVCKRDLVATHKFDEKLLQPYADKDFVLLKDVARGSFIVVAALSSDSAGRGLVSIDGGTGASSVQKEFEEGDSVTVECMVVNQDDVFDGWYIGGVKVSSETTYTFTAQEAVTLVAKVGYISVIDKIELGAKTNLSNTFVVDTNIDWVITSE